MKKRLWRVCELCKIVKIPKGRQKYCGTYLKKIGCSWLKHQERRRNGVNKWFRTHPVEAREHDRKKTISRTKRGYWKEKYAKSKLTPLNNII